MTIVDRILKSIKTIPAFPATGNKVAQLLNQVDYSVVQVANIIKFDPSITANILKMANSLISVHCIESAILMTRLFIWDSKTFSGQSRRPVFPSIIKKALRVILIKLRIYGSIACRRLDVSNFIKKNYGQEDTTLYTAALLHDVGKIIMGEFVRDEMKKIWLLVELQKMSFLEAEETVLGINHADLGGKIAEQWNFPIEITEAIAYHHRPDLLEKEEKIMPWIVYMADQACLMIGVGGGVEGLAQRAVSQLLKKFNLRMRDLETSMVLLSDDLDQPKNS